MLIAALCAGCSGDSQASTATPTARATLASPSSSPTPDDGSITAADDAKTAAAKSLAAYRSMWAAFDKAEAVPDPDLPDLAASATGEALALLRAGIASDKKEGLRGTGKAKFSPQDVKLTPADKPTNVTIRDCIDSSNTRRVYITPQATPYKDTPGGRRLTIAFVARQEDGSWKVTSVGVRDVGTC